MQAQAEGRVQHEHQQLLDLEGKIRDSQAQIVRLRHDRHEGTLQLELEVAEEIAAGRDLELKRNEWKCKLEQIEDEYRKLQAEAAARVQRNEVHIAGLKEAQNEEAAQLEAQIDGMFALWIKPAICRLS